MNTCDNPFVRCPKCESEYVIQIHRSRVEKWVTTKCKYQCTACSKQFYIQKLKAIPLAQGVPPPSESFFHFFRS